MCHSGNNFYPISNRWVGIVFVVVEMWTWIILLGAPFRRYAPPTEELDWLGALQPWTFLSTFTIIFAFWVTLTMCKVLAKPFGQDTDTFNIDALIGGTEQTAFHNLRASFNSKAARMSSAKPSDGAEHNTLPAGWKAVKTPEGRDYYYHMTSKESTWKRPSAAKRRETM